MSHDVSGLVRQQPNHGCSHFLGMSHAPERQSGGYALPITGWFVSLIGRKRFFLICILLFTISSLLCGIAPMLPFLLLERVIQGAGGGGLQPMAQAILADTFPPEKRGLAFSATSCALRRWLRQRVPRPDPKNCPQRTLHPGRCSSAALTSVSVFSRPWPAGTAGECEPTVISERPSIRIRPCERAFNVNFWRSDKPAHCETPSLQRWCKTQLPPAACSIDRG